MKVLLEMRPALDGYSGIPQETRLLFRGLASVQDVQVLGLLQSSNLILDPGLPLRNGKAVARVDAAGAIDLLSQVVVSLQQGPAAHRFEHLRKRWLRLVGPLGAAVWSLVGGKVALTAFDAAHFKDFIWRGLFEKSLPSDDFEAVTACEFRVMRWPWSAMQAIGVASSWVGHAVYPRLDTAGLDVMVVETPYPGRCGPGTRLVVRYHDAVPLLLPHTVKDRGYHRAAHFHALRRNAADGAWFACVSEATRQDLLTVLPEVAPRAVTIPNMISHHFRPEDAPATRVPEVLWSRKNRSAPHGGGAPVAAADMVDGALPYLLMVSTIEPRKNHLALLDAWERLRADRFPQLNLVCVGGLGWDHHAVMQRFTPWLERGGLHLLSNVPAADLRLLYRHAQATVCPSLAEGFDFSGIEAMRCGGVVAASDIPVHREIFGQAAAYFGAYAPEALMAAVERVIEPDAVDLRQALRAEGQRVAAQYTPQQVLPQWQEFLRHVVA